MKFFSLMESRPRGSFMTQASKLVGSYNAHVKTLVRQYEAAVAKKQTCIKWLMLWTYQSQVALAYVSAYPSEPEIKPDELVSEMMSKVSSYINVAMILDVVKYFVEHNEEAGAISLAQKAVTMPGSPKIDIMNVSKKPFH